MILVLCMSFEPLGYKTDKLPMQIKDAVGNEYGRPKDVAGENRYAFTSHADSAFDVCFMNILNARKLPQHPHAYLRCAAC